MYKKHINQIIAANLDLCVSLVGLLKKKKGKKLCSP